MPATKPFLKAINIILDKAPVIKSINLQTDKSPVTKAINLQMDNADSTTNFVNFKSAVTIRSNTTFN